MSWQRAALTTFCYSCIPFCFFERFSLVHVAIHLASSLSKRNFWSIISYERRLKRTCVSYYLPSLTSLPNCTNESHSANLQLWKLWLNGRSVASAIRKYLASRSPYLKKQIRYDLQSTLCNSTTNELCDKVKSRGGMGCSKPVQCFIKVTKEVN